MQVGDRLTHLNGERLSSLGELRGRLGDGNGPFSFGLVRQSTRRLGAPASSSGGGDGLGEAHACPPTAPL